MGTVGLPAQRHRAPGEPQDAARLTPELPDAHQPAAVKGKDGVLPQPQLGQRVLPRNCNPRLGGLGAEQGGVDLLERYPPRAGEPERRGLLPQSPQDHLLAPGQRKRAALPVKAVANMIQCFTVKMLDKPVEIIFQFQIDNNIRIFFEIDRLNFQYLCFQCLQL